MSALLERYLPRIERRTALWLVLGATVVSVLANMLGQSIMTAMMMASSAADIPLAGAYAVQALAEFSLVSVLVVVLIRIARAPRALAMFIVLTQALTVAVSAAGWLVSLVPALGGVTDVSNLHLFGLLMPVAVALGAVTGAWVASTVSLARIRDTGFSGDDGESDGLRRKPGAMGWHFIGWEGRPLSGDGLIAAARGGAAVIPALATLLGGVVFAMIGGVDENTALVIGIALTAVAGLMWFPSTWLVVRRSSVASAWLMSLETLIMTALWLVYIAVQSGAQGVLPMLGTSAASAIVPVVAALLGAALALRRQPATLDASDPQDPDATSASADTAGGTDG